MFHTLFKMGRHLKFLPCLLFYTPIGHDRMEEVCPGWKDDLVIKPGCLYCRKMLIFLQLVLHDQKEWLKSKKKITTYNKEKAHHRTGPINAPACG